VSSDAGLSLQTTQCPLLRGVVPWVPMIPVEMVPSEAGGDRRYSVSDTLVDCHKIWP
jgi:hypothetical protein